MNLWSNRWIQLIIIIAIIIGLLMVTGLGLEIKVGAGGFAFDISHYK